MAPIDIVEAESEVARNDEAVIVAESAIEQARGSAACVDPGSRLAGLLDRDARADRDAGVPRTAGERRGGRSPGAREPDRPERLARNNLARTDVNIRYYKNQALPEVNAEASYATSAVGGVQLNPLPGIPTGPVPPRSILAQRAYGSVLGDVFTSDFPSWTVGVSVAYPIGTSPSEASLAQARLQLQQEQTQLRNLELQVATQVRDVARQVQTNQKRVDAAGPRASWPSAGSRPRRRSSPPASRRPSSCSRRSATWRRRAATSSGPPRITRSRWWISKPCSRRRCRARRRRPLRDSRGQAHGLGLRAQGSRLSPRP